MSKTVQDALNAFAYYIGSGGYYEKASAKNLSRAVSDFAANKGSGNYTYMGKLCGCNPGAWCAMMVSTAVYEACGGDRNAAKKAMWGRWPHYNCGTIFDDAMVRGRAYYSWYGRNKKGKSGAAYTPRAGDVIVFTDAWKTRDHTGMVYAVDGDTVYTYEGNSGNMARARSYPVTSAYIYGYVQLELEEDGAAVADPVVSGIRTFQRWLGTEADGVYGPVTRSAAVRAHQKSINAQYGTDIAVDGIWGPETYYATRSVQQGDWNDDVYVWQGMLFCRGYDPTGFDGGFGKNTLAATERFQTDEGLSATGVADAYTWARAFGCARPEHTILRRGSNGPEVEYLQRLLGRNGYDLELDGVFGVLTERAVKQYQSDRKLEADGVVGPLTWAEIE